MLNFLALGTEITYLVLDKKQRKFDVACKCQLIQQWLKMRYSEVANYEFESKDIWKHKSVIST